MKACQQVAWNAVRFQCPPGWQVDQIGKRHLRLDNGQGPVMEAKWGPVRGRFSHKAHLKRLDVLNARRTGGRVAAWEIPDAWKAAVADYQACGFQWQGAAADGRGVSLYCPVCRQAALIQFFLSTPGAREKQFLTVLQSFRDHSNDGQTAWSLFDIRARLPQTFQLRRFRFDAGKFELEFSDGRQNLRLHRWAPAKALLAGADLAGFAGRLPGFSAAPLRSATINGHPAVEGRTGPAPGRPRWIVRIQPRLSFQWVRLWLLEKENRLLGIRSASRYPLDEEQLNKICMHYVAV